MIGQTRTDAPQVSVAVSGLYNSVIKGRALPGVCGRLHVSHRDGQQVCCGEEDHAAQSQAHSHKRVFNGRWIFASGCWSLFAPES